MTKTGISEALRTIPDEPKSGDDLKHAIAALHTLSQTLTVATRNKHIQAEKKAFACVKDVLQAVDHKHAAYEQTLAKLEAAAKAKVAAEAKAEAKAKRQKLDAAIWAKAYPMLVSIRKNAQAFKNSYAPADAKAFIESCGTLHGLAKTFPKDHPLIHTESRISGIAKLVGEFAACRTLEERRAWIVESSQPFNMLTHLMEKLSKDAVFRFE